MTEELSEKDVQNLIAQVKHPAIDRTLVELGIVKSVSVEDKKVKILFAFPFPNIPIGDQLISSIVDVVEGHGWETGTETTIMTPEEVQRFLSMEQQGWTGGV